MNSKTFVIPISKKFGTKATSRAAAGDTKETRSATKPEAITAGMTGKMSVFEKSESVDICLN